jgi:hypothetical protein
VRAAAAVWSRSSAWHKSYGTNHVLNYDVEEVYDVKDIYHVKEINNVEVVYNVKNIDYVEEFITL